MAGVLNAIKAALFASIFTMKLGQGLDIKPEDLRYLQGRWGLMLRSLLTVIVLMPIATLIIILLLRPSPGMAVALSILAASPAAPLMTMSARRAGGHSGYSASLQLALAVLSVISVPLILVMMASVLGFKANVNPIHVARQVATAQFIPIGLGILIGTKSDKLTKLGHTLAGIATILTTAIVVVIIVVMHKAFMQIDIRSFAAILLTVAAELFLGHMMAPRVPEMQATLAMETAFRNPGLAMFIASLNFPKAKPLPLLIPYMVVLLTMSTLYIRWQNGRLQRAERSETV